MKSYHKLSTTLSVAALCFGVASPTYARGKDKKLEAKIGAYVYALNTATRSVFEAQKNYARYWEDYEVGPTCTEKRMPSQLYFSSLMPSVWQDLAKVVKSKPKLKDLDPAAQTIATTLEKFSTLGREVSQYYQKREYKNDNCAKGKEYHKTLVAMWKDYDQADQVIRAFVIKRNDEREQGDLAATQKKYGKNMRYHAQKTMIDAKAMVRGMEAELKKPEPDLAALKQAGAPFQETLKGLVDLGEKNRSMADTFGYLRYMRAAQGLDKAVTEFIERIETKKEFSKYEEKSLKSGSQSVKGSFPRIMSQFNGLITQSNQLRFPSKVK